MVAGTGSVGWRRVQPVAAAAVVGEIPVRLRRLLTLGHATPIRVLGNVDADLVQLQPHLEFT